MAVIKIKQQIVEGWQPFEIKGFTLETLMIGCILTNLNTGLTDF